MSRAKLCPVCGVSLTRTKHSHWDCDNTYCRVQFVLYHKNGSIKKVVFVGVKQSEDPHNT